MCEETDMFRCGVVTPFPSSLRDSNRSGDIRWFSFCIDLCSLACTCSIPSMEMWLHIKMFNAFIMNLHGIGFQPGWIHYYIVNWAERFESIGKIIIRARFSLEATAEYSCDSYFISQQLPLDITVNITIPIISFDEYSLNSIFVRKQQCFQKRQTL